MDWSVVLVSLLAVSVCAEDRWIWSGGHNTQDNNVRTQQNVRTPKILARVNAHTHDIQTRDKAPVPEIANFGSNVFNDFPTFFPFMAFAGFMGLQGLPVTQPQLQQQNFQHTSPFSGFMGLQGLPVTQPQLQQQKFQRATPQALLSRPPNHALPLPVDGTTKTRVTEDTAFNIKSVVEDGDKYTTIDKHQSQYRVTQPLPRPREELLGGLDPREVFYADEDLLIIKGGGFNSDKFEEPSQTLDDSDFEDPEFGHGTRVSPLVLPNPDLEYNGNIPAILPPPTSDHGLISQTEDQSHFAVFMESPSRISTMTIYIPYVYSLDDSRNSYNILDFSSPMMEADQNFNSLYVKRSAEEFPVLQSLSRDTAVNYLEPRPSTNEFAEFVGNDRQQIMFVDQPIVSHQTPQVVYHQPHSVYQYPPVYPYQTVYNQPNTVEIYSRPGNLFSRPRPQL